MGIFEWKCTDFCSIKENITHFPIWILPLTAFISWIQHYRNTKSHILFIVMLKSRMLLTFPLKPRVLAPALNKTKSWIPKNQFHRGPSQYSWFLLMLKGFKLPTSCFVSKLEPLTVNRVSRCREFHPCCGMFNIPFSSKEILLLLSFSSRFLERPLILKAVWK